MQSAAQFTPEQLIVAGRRAEQQGQVGYALQFYRYLAEKYPNTAEAFEARDALFRLHGADPQQPQTQRPANAPRTRPPTASEQAAAASRNPQDFSLSASDRAAATSERAAHRAVAPQVPVARQHGYRAGRFVAAILSTLGWLLLLLTVAGAIALVVLLTVKASPRALQELAAANLLVAIGGLFGSLFVGLIAVFAGQLARATFDNADLTRWLAAVLVPDDHQE